MEILSIIPPLFIADWAWDKFSKSPVNIPSALFPKFIAEFIALFTPSFSPPFIKLSFTSINSFSIKSGKTHLSPISIAELIVFPKVVSKKLFCLF